MIGTKRGFATSAGRPGRAQWALAGAEQALETLIMAAVAAVAALVKLL